MIEGQWAGERSRLGVKVGDKVGVKFGGRSRSGVKGGGHGRGLGVGARAAVEFSVCGGVEMKRKCS